MGNVDRESEAGVVAEEEEEEEVEEREAEDEEEHRSDNFRFTCLGSSVNSCAYSGSILHKQPFPATLGGRITF